MDDEELEKALEPLRKLLGRQGTAAFEREIEFETKNHHQTEVKLMASIDFEDVKKKIVETADTVKEKTTTFVKNVAGKSSDAAKNVAGKASGAAKKAKLNAQIAAEREGMKKKYIELGKLYFEKYSSNPDPDLEEPMTAIREALDRVAAHQAEIDALRDAPEPEEPEAEQEAEEADHIVDAVEDTVEAAADQAAAMAEETAEEAKKTFENVVDSVDKEL